MKKTAATILATSDVGLESHWKKVFGARARVVQTQLNVLSRTSFQDGSVVWVDLSSAENRNLHVSEWASFLKDDRIKAIAGSSDPTEDEAIDLLDCGFMGYCHAYSDLKTLRQVNDVVQSGSVWIGKKLMQRLIKRVNTANVKANTTTVDWSNGLTPREIQIAVLAANGASNLAIAEQCAITERTVKAHLGTVFQKLNVTDRLQLALTVHGIH